MTKSRADRLTDVLRILEFVHGPARVQKNRSLAEQAAALVLRRTIGAELSGKALDALLLEFTDLNEIRISYTREVAAVLAALGVVNPRRPAQQLRDYMERLYRKKNGVDLGFLKQTDEEADPIDPDGLYLFFKSFKGLGEGGAAALLALWLPEDRFLGVPDVLRLPGRLGLGGTKPTPARTRNALEEVADEKQRFQAHLLFGEHSVDICRSRNPLCGECPLGSICSYGATVLKREGKKAVPAPTSRQLPPPEVEEVAKKPKPVKKAPAKKPPAKKAPAKKAPAKKAPAKKPPAKKPPAKKPPAKKPPAKKAPAKKAPAKKAPAKKAPAKKAPAKKAPAKKPPAKKPPAKKAPAKKAPAKKAPAKKPPAKKPPAKKPPAKKAPAKKAPAKKAAPKKPPARKKG